MKLPPGENESDGPNLTPIIDVVFLLLIFFLVATRLDRAENERRVPVNLPEVVEAQPIALTKPLVIDVGADGTYRVRNRAYAEAELQELLLAEAKANPHRKVQIHGDADSAWKHGVRVMGMCNRARIEDYQVAVIEQKQ